MVYPAPMVAASLRNSRCRDGGLHRTRGCDLSCRGSGVGVRPGAAVWALTEMVRPAPWFCFLAPARIRSMAMLLDRFQARVAAWSLTGLILTALVAALVLL